MLKALQFSLALIACGGMLTPRLSTAAAPAPVEIKDVRLGADGALVGQVTDQAGAVRVGEPVALAQGETLVAQTVTNQEGRFQFPSVRGGVYQVGSTGTVGVYRLWSGDAAPPHATSGVLLVHGDQVALGNFHHYPGHFMYWLSNPWVMGGIIAAAIAVPAIIANTDDDDGPSS